MTMYNNTAERALRAVALGRKNWLFAGSDDGGDRAAAMYTLIGTANLNDLNPEAYLRYVLQHIADHPIGRLDDLLPWNVSTQLSSRTSRLMQRTDFEHSPPGSFQSRAQQRLR